MDCIPWPSLPLREPGGPYVYSPTTVISRCFIEDLMVWTGFQQWIT
jgi:hypothetical protein